MQQNAWPSRGQDQVFFPERSQELARQVPKVWWHATLNGPTAFALGSQDTARFKGKQQGSANIHSLNEQLVGRKYAEAEKTAKEMLARNPAELPAVASLGQLLVRRTGEHCRQNP